jgi:hypothetical protein
MLFWYPEKRVSIFQRLAVIKIRSSCFYFSRTLAGQAYDHLKKDINFMTQ